jgi:hypothetical protein
MAILDFEGTGGGTFERVLVPADAYEATVASIEPKVFETSGQFGARSRIIMRWRLPDGKEVPEFLSTSVRKGSGAFKSTSLYVLLEKANLLDTLKNYAGLKTEITDDEVIQWLQKNMVGKRALVMVETVNPQGGGQQYSVVKAIIKFTT